MAIGTFICCWQFADMTVSYLICVTLAGEVERTLMNGQSNEKKEEENKMYK